MNTFLLKIRVFLCAALISPVSIASAQVVLNLDGEIVPIESTFAEITFIPSESRLVIKTQWDDLRCILNPDGPQVSLPEPQPGDFVLELDHRTATENPNGQADLLGRYVIDANDGSIFQSIGTPTRIDIVTSAARVNNCTAGTEPQCAILVCASGGTPVFSDSLETPPPPQVDIVVNGLGTASAVAGSAPNNIALQITAQNISLNDASNVVIDLSSSLPSGVASGLVFTSTGSYNATSNEWSMPSFPAGSDATATLQFTAEPDATSGSDVCVTGSVVSADQQIINTSNDVHQQCSSVEREVDLVLQINDPSSASSGETVAYVVSIDNMGPSDASNVVVDFTDQIPSGISRSTVFVSAGTLDDSNWSNGQGINWTLANIAAGSTVTRTLNLLYTVDESVVDGSTMQVDATVTANETQINQADDSDSDTTAFSNP
ncbi:MAG: hypothetical protein AAF446_06955 [Pseudomonadota bacterium]